MNTFLSNLFSWSAIGLLVSAMGCNAERVAVVAVGPALLREQEIRRFRATDVAREPVVFGKVEGLDKAGSYALSAAIISLDNMLAHADAAGNYRLALEPGTHQLMAGQIGIHQSRLTLEVKRGDSIRIDFHLRPDLRPLE